MAAHRKCVLHGPVDLEPLGQDLGALAECNGWDELVAAGMSSDQATCVVDAATADWGSDALVAAGDISDTRLPNLRDERPSASLSLERRNERLSAVAFR